ncbi:uncharacterized protein BCR38DRAFT_64688 [Pseudomassariella vexata]|uniref:Uncharacterized protein n=1 Tax=Pseudomassariella vexata TaxID=1141098 RepID=A0A1Y2DJ17_9PEZI|nr:uncharacterized protein BCR38DRAFT_64688 [Pseudomassariella vexata]ORY59124.1 hypothetical protein BCR38DRAFT_64688 [Pseudomassariella vexata]
MDFESPISRHENYERFYARVMSCLLRWEDASTILGHRDPGRGYPGCGYSNTYLPGFLFHCLWLFALVHENLQILRSCSWCMLRSFSETDE